MIEIDTNAIQSLQIRLFWTYLTVENDEAVAPDYAVNFSKMMLIKKQTLRNEID